MNTTHAVTPTTSMMSTIATMAEFISPVLTSSSVPPIADGRPETMLARMIIEMPLPIPRSVICSPSHMRNSVPVTSVTMAVKTKLKPGLMTSPWFCRATAAPMDWNPARPTVP